MQHVRDLIRPHPYPRDLDRIAQEFGRQLDDRSCGAAAVHHGLLLGGLTIPKAALQAIFGNYRYGIDGESLQARLHDLGLEPEYLKRRPSVESTSQFLERLGQEMDRGAFVLACIYGGKHWITLGRWKDGRIRAVDSYVEQWFPSWKWDLGMYSLTPAAFDDCDWLNDVQLVRPGIWQKNYEEWLPGRDRLLRLAGHSLEASATMAQRLREAAEMYLDDDRYAYEQLEFCLSDKSSMAVKVRDPRSQAIAVSTPTANEQEGQVVVVRRLLQSDQGRPVPPELIFRMSALRGWQLA